MYLSVSYFQLPSIDTIRSIEIEKKRNPALQKLSCPHMSKFKIIDTKNKAVSILPNV